MRLRNSVPSLPELKGRSPLGIKPRAEASETIGTPKARDPRGSARPTLCEGQGQATFPPGPSAAHNSQGGV